MYLDQFLRLQALASHSKLNLKVTQKQILLLQQINEKPQNLLKERVFHQLKILRYPHQKEL